MSFDPNQQPQTPPAAQASAAPAIDPADYYRTQQENAELRGNQAKFSQFLEQLDPYADVIRRMLEDEQAASVISDSLSAFDTIRERQKPKIDPQWDPSQNPYVAKIDKLTEFAEKWEQQSQAVQQQEQQERESRALQQGREFMDDLGKKFPVLRENENAGLRGILSYSQMHGLDLQTAAEQMKPLYSGAAQSAAPSLRTDMGASGVPGPSAAPQYEGEHALVNRAKEILRENLRSNLGR